MAYVTWFASFIERHWNQESKNWCSSYSCKSSRDVTHQDINKTKMSFMEKKKINHGWIYKPECRGYSVCRFQFPILLPSKATFFFILSSPHLTEMFLASLRWRLCWADVSCCGAWLLLMCFPSILICCQRLQAIDYYAGEISTLIAGDISTTSEVWDSQDAWVRERGM